MRCERALIEIAGKIGTGERGSAMVVRASEAEFTFVASVFDVAKADAFASVSGG